ncbi:hypothetical protein [Arthrobacter sp. JCM 19049]|uniref:hypothetical protein n=1 Tax=Arthrobacter sp. JCM 19049 TaxID=1460643 RepID=UPI0024373F9B|nr:hypothetical protein [Arthrobacter sp. JCM 19049]
MFVSILAGTVVASSLPVIVADLHGSQTAYTWVVTATLLATTVSTPIWASSPTWATASCCCRSR